MKIEKTLSQMYPGTSKVVIELVVEYALRAAHEGMTVETLEEIENCCIVSRKPHSNSTMLDETELEFELRCAHDKHLSNICGATGMLHYAKLTEAVPDNYYIDEIWNNALTLARDFLSVLV